MATVVYFDILATKEKHAINTSIPSMQAMRPRMGGSDQHVNAKLNSTSIQNFRITREIHQIISTKSMRRHNITQMLSF